jgi:hypothetical protein
MRRGWTGKILEIVDEMMSGGVVKCYSLVAFNFDSHGRRGQYVAEIGLEMRRLP